MKAGTLADQCIGRSLRYPFLMFNQWGSLQKTSGKIALFKWDFTFKQDFSFKFSSFPSGSFWWILVAANKNGSLTNGSTKTMDEQLPRNTMRTSMKGRPHNASVYQLIWPNNKCSQQWKKTVNDSKNRFFLGGKPCHKHLQAWTSERSFMADQPAGWT